MKNKMEFYHSKGKLFLGIIIPILFIALGVLMLMLAYVEEDVVMTLLGLFVIISLSFFGVANLLKMIRGYPYITLTDEYIQLDSFTKSEATIYFKDIDYIKVTEVSFQSNIEIILYDEDDYFAELSFHNKFRLFMNRLTGFSLFTISAKVIQKQERSVFLETLDRIIQQKLNNEAPIIETRQKENVEAEFMEKYDPTPPVNRSIDRAYFLSSYGYSFLMFAFSFVLFYLLISKNENYLLYIFISFILYPFAKVLIDWLFGFKLRHSLDKQKGVTYYFQQLIFILDLLLFHVSLFVAPIGIVFLLIRLTVDRNRR